VSSGSRRDSSLPPDEVVAPDVFWWPPFLFLLSSLVNVAHGFPFSPKTPMSLSSSYRLFQSFLICSGPANLDQSPLWHDQQAPPRAAPGPFMSCLFLPGLFFFVPIAKRDSDLCFFFFFLFESCFAPRGCSGCTHRRFFSGLCDHVSSSRRSTGPPHYSPFFPPFLGVGNPPQNSFWAEVLLFLAFFLALTPVACGPPFPA